jgi:hypothetical protein
VDEICTNIDGIESSVEYLDVVLKRIEEKLSEIENKK